MNTALLNVEVTTDFTAIKHIVSFRVQLMRTIFFLFIRFGLYLDSKTTEISNGYIMLGYTFTP